MKKLLAVLLVLGLAGGAAFAEITFGGGVNTGFNLKYIDTADYNDDYEAYANSWHDDAGFKGELKGSYSEDYYGVSVGLRGIWSNYTIATGWDSQKDEIITDTLTWKFEAYDIVGWMKPLQSDLLTVTAGQTGGEWGSGGKLDTGSRDADIRLTVKPIEGLSFGFTLGDRYFANEERNRKAENYFKKTSFGVKYNTPGLLDAIAVGYQLDDDKKENPSDAHKIWAGVLLKDVGVAGLKINAGVRATYLSDFSDQGQIRGALGAEFGAGPFYVSGGFLVNMFQTKGLNKDGKEATVGLGWKAEVEPSYWIIQDKLKGILYFGINNDWENAGLVDKDEMNYEVSPRIEYSIVKIGNGEINSYYDFSYQGNGYNKDPVKSSRMVHQLGIRFNWAF